MEVRRDIRFLMNSKVPILICPLGNLIQNARPEHLKQLWITPIPGGDLSHDVPQSALQLRNGHEPPVIYRSIVGSDNVVPHK